jgi:eukaryotic-like serine/threonine-protein kinase
MNDTPGTDGLRRGEPPPAGTLVPRHSLGAGSQPYIVRDTLGSGGMGVVVVATDQDLNRPVAMKIMWDARDAVAARRFAFEAEVTAQLDHPNIVPVHERGMDGRGRPYYTMRMVRGSSLAEILDLQSLGNASAAAEFPLNRLVRVLVEVTNAIAYAHDRGVIHRDLKPHNIMVGRYGEVQVMDWGLARMLDRPEPDEPGRVGGDGQRASGVAVAVGSRQITRHGSVRGTPAYMPPEQARGETWRLDRPSDVYAIGAILYEILTLTPPFQGTTAQDVLEAVAAGDLEPAERRAPHRAVPRALAAVVEKAMSWHPADRYATAADLRRDLEAWLDNRPVSAHAESPMEALARIWQRHRIVLSAASLGVSLAVGAVSVAFISTLNARRDAEQAQLAAETSLATARNQAEQAAPLRMRAAPALVAQAREDLAAGRGEDARRSLYDAVACHPAYAEARALLAGVLAVLGDGPGAQREIAALATCDPDRHDLPRWQAAVGAGLPRSRPDAWRALLMEYGLATWAEDVRQSQRRQPR